MGKSVLPLELFLFDGVVTAKCACKLKPRQGEHGDVDLRNLSAGRASAIYY